MAGHWDHLEASSLTCLAVAVSCGWDAVRLPEHPYRTPSCGVGIISALHGGSRGEYPSYKMEMAFSDLLVSVLQHSVACKPVMSLSRFRQRPSLSVRRESNSLWTYLKTAPAGWHQSLASPMGRGGTLVGSGRLSEHCPPAAAHGFLVKLSWVSVILGASCPHPGGDAPSDQQGAPNIPCCLKGGGHCLSGHNHPWMLSKEALRGLRLCPHCVGPLPTNSTTGC